MISEQEKHLANFLIQERIITQEQANVCWQIMQKYAHSGRPIHFSSVLINQKYITSKQLSYAIQQIQSQIKASDFDSNKTIQIGKKFNHYRIDQELGKGGMGAVYKAYDCKLNRIVALKIILTQEHIAEQQVKRFMQEARAMAKLRHPNVIEIYEVGEKPQNFFTMEYVDGDLFAQWIRKNKKAQPKQIAEILKKCAQALSEVHKHGIVHRDIKPGNIMLNHECNPKLMDFGLAKVADSDLSRTGEIIGTPAYMSPEQTQGTNIDTKSDIYSLGAALYEALVKRPPFQGATFVNVACQITESDPVSPRILDPDIPVDLEAICLKCLEKLPKKRYQSATRLANDLENFIKGKPVAAKPATRWTSLKKWILRNKAIAIASIVTFLLLNAFVWSLVIGIKRSRVAQKIAQEAQKIAEREKLKALAAQKITEKEKLKALTAQKIAEKEKRKALTAQNKEKKSKQELQKQLYVAQMLVAGKYIEENSLKAANNILEMARKENNALGWEWGWFYQKIHKEMLSLQINFYYALCAFSPTEMKIAFTGKLDKGKGEPVVVVNIWDIRNYSEYMAARQISLEKARKSGEIRILKGHTFTSVSALLFSPDGSKLISATVNGFLTLWEVKTGHLLRKMQTKSQSKIYNCAFSPDGTRIVFVNKSGAVRLWDVTTGKETLLGYHQQQTPFGDYAATKAVSCAFSPDGSKIVTSGGKLILWDVPGLRKIKEQKGSLSYKTINWCSFSPDGTMIASASHREVTIWDAQLNKALKVLKGHTDTINSCLFTKDSKKIISCSDDFTIRIWDVVKGKELKNIKGHEGSVNAVSLNNNILASCGQSLKVWNLLNLLANPKVFPGTAYSAKRHKNIVAIGGLHSLNIWDTRRQKKWVVRTKKVSSLDISPDGK